jgi:hypothetical protein
MSLNGQPTKRTCCICGHSILIEGDVIYNDHKCHRCKEESFTYSRPKKVEIAFYKLRDHLYHLFNLTS